MLTVGQTGSGTKLISHPLFPVLGCTGPPTSLLFPPLATTQYPYLRLLPLSQPRNAIAVGRLPSVMVEDINGLGVSTSSLPTMMLLK